MCPRSSFKRKRTVMTNELFDTIIEKTKAELQGINTFTFSGFGEFAEDKEWKYKLKKARENFKCVNVLTNASLLSENDLEFLLTNSDSIRISNYGIDNDSYNR